VVFSGYDITNIVESGDKHHNPNPQDGGFSFIGGGKWRKSSA
jgi:hypothetical protein